MEADKSLLESLTPGIVHARGVFETMRTYHGRIFAFDRHFKRMQRGCALYQIKIPFSKKKLGQYIYKLMKKGSLKEARIRVALWRDSGVRLSLHGLHISIVCQPLRMPSRLKYEQGFKAIILEIRRNRTKFSHIKSMGYQLFRQALLEAKQRGFDEAILLDNKGIVVEGATTNIFFVKRGILYTPSVHCGCLNGITRQIITQCAQKTGIVCKRVMPKVRSYLAADEAFLTNSIVGVMPLTFLDGHPIGQGKVGPITLSLSQAYRGRLLIHRG